MCPGLGCRPCSGRLGFVWDVFFEDGLLKMNNSLGFAQALTPGSKKPVGSMKYQCSSSVDSLGVRVQDFDRFARQNPSCHSGLSKSP